MRCAYADPPYLGSCARYGHDHGAEGACWDDVATHWELVARLRTDFPDGWALSMSAASMPALFAGGSWAGVRIGAWVKPFATFKPGVNPGYCWEVVAWAGGRRRSRDEGTVRDFYSGAATLRRGFVGAKPDGFCFWVFGLLGLAAGDELVDLFPGSGAVSAAWASYRRQGRLIG